MASNLRKSGRPLTREEPAMNIEIRDAALEARIKKQLQATGSANLEEVLLRLLETQEEQDRWLLENREAIQGKIRRGIEQLRPRPWNPGRPARCLSCEPESQA
jgi:hypothetical protein